MDEPLTTSLLGDPVPDKADASGQELRAAPRVTLLIRAAKIVSGQGEFVCVIRDVSQTGVSVRLFHALPPCEAFELHMPNGAEYLISRVWARGNEAGFAFARPVDLVRFIGEAGEYPRRGLRLNLCFPATLVTLAQRCEVMIENLSQQGARFECAQLLAIDQAVRLCAPEAAYELREVRAKVRWRRDCRYGAVFDDTFTLGDFARLAARLQAPALLES